VRGAVFGVGRSAEDEQFRPVAERCEEGHEVVVDDDRLHLHRRSGS
jgi:hypothetical protein